MHWNYIPLTSWEELYELPGFLRTPVCPELVKTGRAVQPYSMPAKAGERPCGIKGCAEGHLHGWLILLPNGSKINVGRVCGLNVFGVTWTEHMSVAKANRHAYIKQEAISRARNEAFVAAAEPIEATGEAFDRTRAMEAAFKKLPVAIRESLQARAQDNDTIIWASRAPNAREIAEAKEKGRRPPESVQYEAARLRGLAALRTSGSIDGATSNVRKKAKGLEAIAAKDSSNADTIREALRELRESRTLLAKVPALWATFFDSENIAHLSRLSACKTLGFVTISLESDSTLEIILR